MKEFIVRYIDELGTEFETVMIAQDRGNAIRDMKDWLKENGIDGEVLGAREK